MMDYNSILNDALAVKPKQSRVSVTEAGLRSAALRMAAKGYVHTPETIKALEAYLNGYDILLTGSYGVGKTFFFDCLSTPEAPIVRLNMNEAHLWKFDDLAEFLRDNACCDIVVDDIRGDAGKDYGKAYDPLIIILERRFDTLRRTHYTTNLTNEELISRLDNRDVDRLYTAKPFVITRTESLRMPKPNQWYLNSKTSR